MNLHCIPGIKIWHKVYFLKRHVIADWVENRELPSCSVHPSVLELFSAYFMSTYVYNP